MTGGPGISSSEKRTRMRAGKFSKPKRGGGKHFSRSLQPVDRYGEEISMWAEKDEKSSSEHDDSDENDDDESDDDDDDDDDDDGSIDDSSDSDDSQNSKVKPTLTTSTTTSKKIASSSSNPLDPNVPLTREQRRALAKTRKEAAIKRANQRTVQPGDLPPSDDDNDDDVDDSDNGETQPGGLATSNSGQPSVKGPSTGRESKSLAAKNQKKIEDMEETRAEFERLKLIRQRREADAARARAEREAKAEADALRKQRVDGKKPSTSTASTTDARKGKKK